MEEKVTLTEGRGAFGRRNCLTFSHRQANAFLVVVNFTRCSFSLLATSPSEDEALSEAGSKTRRRIK